MAMKLTLKKQAVEQAIEAPVEVTLAPVVSRTSWVFPLLAGLAVLGFLIVVGLQAGEILFYKQAPSLWPMP